MRVKPFSSKTLVLIIAILLLIAPGIKSQVLSIANDSELKAERDTSWEIGFSIGASKFKKIINPSPDAPYKRYNNWNADNNLGFSVSVIKNFSTILSAELEWLSTKLSGSWNMPPLATSNGSSSPEPFETGVNQFNLYGTVNLNQFFKPSRTNNKWYMFVKGGVGVGILKVYSSFSDFPRVNEGLYSVLYGAGAAYRLNERMKLKAGITMVRTSTDRLDGVHELMPANPPTNPINWSDPYYYYNIKERFVYPYIAMTYRLGHKKIVVPRPPSLLPMLQGVPKPLPVPEIHVQPLYEYNPSVIGKTYTVYYGFNKFDLSPNAMAELDKLATEMLQNAPVNVELKSHTDSRGPAKYNLMLSEIRGKMATYYLLGHGITPNRVNTKGYGETQLLNKCADGVKCTEAEHAVNRRTETTITKRK